MRDEMRARLSTAAAAPDAASFLKALDPYRVKIEINENASIDVVQSLSEGPPWHAMMIWGGYGITAHGDTAIGAAMAVVAKAATVKPVCRKGRHAFQHAQSQCQCGAIKLKHELDIQ